MGIQASPPEDRAPTRASWPALATLLGNNHDLERGRLVPFASDADLKLSYCSVSGGHNHDLVASSVNCRC